MAFIKIERRKAVSVKTCGFCYIVKELPKAKLLLARETMRIFILLLFIVCTSHIAASAQDKERKIVTARIEDAWAKSKTTEPLNLIVLNCDKRGRVYASELDKIFFSTNHLPENLQSRQIYCTSDKCIKRAQYIGKNREGKYTFAVFRWLPEKRDK